MRLAVINCILMALSAAALAEEPRPRRHLHQLSQMIINKLFSSSEPNCTQPTEAPSAPPPLGTKFFRIPGFNNVVIKAVPKGSSLEPAPVYEEEEIPPNSHIGIVSSYLGTTTLNETYNALLGVKNLLSSGILTAKRDVVKGFITPHPLQVQCIGTAPSKLIKPCAAPGLSPLPIEPVRVLVRPPKIPVVPTQYSYKQVNQDGSLTSYTSALDLNNGIRVIEDGRSRPFFIDRVQKIPVRLPVPVLPEVSKIVVSEAVHPTTYSYHQIHEDGRRTPYIGLPSVISMPGPVVVTETVKRIPPPPIYLMDRIEKVAAIASYPRAPLIDVTSKPAITGQYTNTPVRGSPVSEPGPMGYSYSQMNVNGGTTTHSSSGANAAVLVTENGVPADPLNVFPNMPEKNPFGPPRGYGFSYSQVHGGSQVGSFNGLGNQAGSVNVIEHRPSPPSMPLPPNSFSYKQIGDGKMITYTGSGIIEESRGSNPTVVIHGMDHPVPPPHITDRIEKVAAGAIFNRPPYSTPFAVPIPTGFVHIPQVHTSVPHRPVKIPTPSRPSPFMYKHIHNDGSVTSYGGDSFVDDGKAKLPPPADMAKPFPQGNVRVFESDNSPFPMNPVNPNAIKPSTPVSGSYSYKLVNHPPVGPIEEPIVDTFAAPPPLPSMQAPIQGCIEPDATNPVTHISNPLARPAVFFEKPLPLSYSYKQISHSNPNPFLVVNVEDPVMDVKKVNMKLSHTNHGHNDYQSLSLPPSPAQFPSFDEYKPAFVQHGLLPFAQTPADSSPPSSFSYKQVTSQAYQPPPPLPQPAVNVMANKPDTFVQPVPFVPVQNSEMASPPSSYSYKQVTSQAHQPLPSSSQPIGNDMEVRPSAPPMPPQMVNSRGHHIQKDNAPSSFSYKQQTSQGVYEYSDEFPTGVKTNLHSNSPYPQENTSENVHVEQTSVANPSIPMTVSASPMPVPSRSKPNFERRNSFINNPIIVPEQSSFSFKSSNPDGSTITLKNDGHNSVAVQLEEAPKTGPTGQETTIPVPPAPIAKEAHTTEAAFVNDSTTVSLPEKESPGPVSGHAKPMRRRVIKRVKSVKQHRGDIPDTE